MSETSETMGRCFSEVYERRGSPCELKIADAIDRLAADVAAVKDMAQEMALRVPSELGRDACDAAVREQTDRVKRLNARVTRLNAEIERIHHTLMSRTWERDQARLEVERLRAELAARPDANYQEITDSSPAAPPPAVWLTEEERRILKAHVQSLRDQRRAMERGGQTLGYSANSCGIKREADTIDRILSRAGSPPVVVLPTVFARSLLGDELVALQQVKDSLDKAGVSWKEV